MKKIYPIFFLSFPFIASSQNVGVGTSSPQQKLEVAGWIELGNQTEGTTGTAGSIRYNTLGKIQFHNGTAWVDILSTNNSGDYIQNQAVGSNFATGQSASYDITGNAEIGGGLSVNSNVGIGVISPSYKLDVAGDIRTTGKYFGHLNIDDTRAVNSPPSYYNKEVAFDFKTLSAIGATGSGAYGGLMTIAPWEDNSGDAHHQLFFNEGGILWRQGQPDNASWDAWQKILTGTQNISALKGNPVSGGGILSWDGTTFAWTDRIIVIPAGNGNGGYFNTAPWSTYTTPTSIPVPAWNVVYMRPSDADYNSTVGSYIPLQVASYISYAPDAKDIIIAVHNGDNGMLYTAWGIILKSGESYSNASINYNRDIRLGSSYGSLHYGTSGNLGAATSFTPDGANPGLWVEGNNNGSEGGGLFMNGNTMCLWSPGDNDLFRFYDEDDFNTAKVVINNSGNVGIGNSSPSHKLDVSGNIRSVGGTIIAELASNEGGNVALVNPNKTGATTLDWRIWNMTGGYGNGLSFWRYYANGSNAGPSVWFGDNGNVGIGTTTPAVNLSIGGAGANVYGTSAWVENNLHVQGNETLNQGGRGRLRVGTAWNYIGLYADGSSTGANNDLVLGASSGVVRVGPYAASGQHLRWANSFLRDDQGGSIELGGSDIGVGGGNGTPYIDWHVNDGYTRDFDMRMLGTTDGYGPVLTMFSHQGSTQYRYLDFDWIGTYDCWADVSAWRYWANASDWLYYDLYNDLDLIDNIKPRRMLDPKSKEEVMTNDPATVPSFLLKETLDKPGIFRYDINRVSWFSIGAIRQLRQETKTKDADLENRVERLESLLADLTGQKLDKIPFVGKAIIQTGLSNYVMIDSRIRANDNVVVSFENGFAPSYKLKDIRNGSFEIVFEKPLEESLNASYTVQ